MKHAVGVFQALEESFLTAVRDLGQALALGHVDLDALGVLDVLGALDVPDVVGVPGVIEAHGVVVGVHGVAHGVAPGAHEVHDALARHLVHLYCKMAQPPSSQHQEKDSSRRPLQALRSDLHSYYTFIQASSG